MKPYIYFYYLVHFHRINNDKLYTVLLYLFAQNHIDILHVNNEIKTVSGMCQEHTGYHNENTDVCPVLFLIHIVLL